ncbi:MAG TPA: hypothetical protein VND21_10205 [Planctomycetota bacterium]|nr:hypothetical protein [Planctomycetota bacterium]
MTRNARRSVAVAAGVAVLVTAIVWTQRDSAVDVDAERPPTADETPSVVTAEPSALDSRAPRRRMRSPVAETPEAGTPVRRVRVRGRVVPAPGAAAKDVFFFVKDPDGPAFATGNVAEDGAFAADVEDPNYLVVGATRASADSNVRLVAPDADYLVEVEIPLRPRAVLHGVVRDLEGRTLSGLGLLWVDRKLGFGTVRADADPRSAMEGWLTTDFVPWAVTDDAGRFTVAQGHEGEPVSLDPRYALERASPAPGTVDDPFDVRARPAVGIDLRLVDDATGAPLKETARGGFVLRAGGRVFSHGALEGRDGRAFTATAWPGDAPAEAQAEFLLEADFHLPKRGALVCRRGEGARPTEVRFTRTPAGGGGQSVAIRDPAFLALVRQGFTSVTRIETLGGIEIELNLDGHSADDDGVYVGLPQGSHRLRAFADSGFGRLAPWSIEVDVPREGEPAIVVHPPIGGSVRLVDPSLPHGHTRTAVLQLERAKPGDGEGSWVVHVNLEEGGTRIPQLPEGDWVLVEYLPSGPAIRERARWPFHVDRDRETVVEMR